MKKLLLATASGFAIAFAAAPASALFSGTFTVTFFGGPSHTQDASQCVDFTQTSGIDGFPDSGTWNSSTFGGWGGNFVHDGKVLRWYGTYSSGAGVTDFYSDVKGRNGSRGGDGGFDDWNVSGVSANNDGITTLVPGCDPGNLHQTNTPSK